MAKESSANGNRTQGNRIELSCRFAHGHLGFGLVLGCYGGNKKPVTPEQLKGRFDAASAMSNIRERDDAFVALAHDAADAGESEFVTKAIDKLTNIAQKDSTAHSCALTLSERGKSQAAVEIAKKISNLAKQNEALGRIARGQ